MKRIFQIEANGPGNRAARIARRGLCVWVKVVFSKIEHIRLAMRKVSARPVDPFGRLDHTYGFALLNPP